ncbi:chemotaxis protein MotA [Rhodovulum imhoffii]|uniref:Chemotaxis protein MotA n=1 Tax=Rhodovulum imhoffii TaxID=365340 RepID=A0A2T5BRQ5_9RHOB|nr:flagellar motor stator protein MotA [Rhodovulum imhoffii]MBK5934072.1 flagellar motor stator protein MotA [Rhodovulum imhoffii]PTN01957.1 chemotaxis protein MotA [Rhodovulum imhoffii]
MIGLVGIVLVFAMVFGGYIAAGGKMSIVLHAMPYELAIIGGAATGSFVIGNDLNGIRRVLGDLPKVFRGAKWKPEDYRDLLCLLFELIRLARQNPISLEEHIEAPDRSDIFARYQKILSDREAVELICDTLRSASMNYDDPHQVEEMLEKRIESSMEDSLHSSRALQTMADGLPALGIVAAVLGVIKTMASIDQPPEVLGRLIGGALVGTFLGVFLAYGLVGPFSTKLKAIVEEEIHFYRLIREVLVANLYNHPPNLCIEVGRQATPAVNRPRFADLEEALKSARKEAA